MKQVTWVTAGELVEKLGISPSHLKTLRKSVFKPKKHYRNISPGAARPTYRYHLKKCEEVLNVS